MRRNEAGNRTSPSAELQTPVVFCHDGRPKFLETAMLAAELSGHQVFCVSNAPKDLAAERDLATFDGVYRHFSSNPEAFERLCFYRYFALRKFLREQRREAAFLADSDVLILRNLGGLVDQIRSGGCDVALSIPEERDPVCADASPHLSFWTLSKLDDFIGFTIRQYQTALEGIRELAEAKALRGMRSGISDMTLLFLWSRSIGGVFNVAVCSAAGVVDHNINIVENAKRNEFVGFLGAKRVYFRSDGVFLRNRSSGRLAPALALHFQGRAKLLMTDVASGRRGRFYVKFAVLRIGTFLLRRLQAVIRRFNRLRVVGPKSTVRS
jgi:hypothetical protein